jgi:homoserine O-acetyltransferase
MSAFPPDAASAAQRIPLPTPFRLQSGGELRGAELAVETYGRLTPARDNAILLFTGLSASAHAASHPGDPSPGWWEHMIGAGKAFDTERYFVVSVNSLGSCFGSTGPGSADPATGAPYGGGFPELRVEDIARGSQAAADALGIGRLHAVVGASLGGMTALAHGALFPGKTRLLASISGALAASASAVATRSLQREILGSALRGTPGAPSVSQAMRWARKLGVLSYVGSDLLAQRFGRDQTEPFAGRASGTAFEVENWLEHLAQKFERQFEPWSYWYISRAMDLFDFGDHGAAAGGAEGPGRRKGPASLALAAARLQVEHALVVGVHEDILFPLPQQRAIADTLKGAGLDTEFVELSSPYGHDAFLTETALFTPVLRTFLQRARGSATSRRSHPAHDSLSR